MLTAQRLIVAISGVKLRPGFVTYPMSLYLWQDGPGTITRDGACSPMRDNSYIGIMFIGITSRSSTAGTVYWRFQARPSVANTSS
jgi:hypothetical protein